MKPIQSLFACILVHQHVLLPLCSARNKACLYSYRRLNTLLSGDGSKPLSVTRKFRLAAFSYASYLPLPSRSSRLLGIAPAGMIVSSNPPPTSRPRRSFHMVGLCRFCFIADPLGPLAAALLMERGLSSA